MVSQLLIDRSSDDSTFHGIAGVCPSMREIFRQIETVGPTDATVLILGETGTGKELVANAVHSLSARGARPLVKLNCSGIMPSLLESELFGHERGAFTGAIARRTGRFELANQGTMFLDEVGELPLDVQPKLLRVLQEREFERVGSSQTLRADVRLVAATHRHLDEMCAGGDFREDLLYRLNVFPIQLPPLRRRRDDLPALVASLLPRIAARMGKDVRFVSEASMRSLYEHEWPGNIRELQNVLERAVILSEGPVLEVRVGSPEGAAVLGSTRSAGGTPYDDAWPGKIRELRSVLKQALSTASGAELLPALLPQLGPVSTSRVSSSPPPHQPADSRGIDSVIDRELAKGSDDIHGEVHRLVDRHVFTRVLTHTRGNRRDAARLLGISRQTMRSRLRALGMQVAPAIGDSADDEAAS